MTLLDVLSEIKQSVPATAADETRHFSEAASVGDYWRQGDLYITKVDDDEPRCKEVSDRQLAPGTTKGSRHVLNGGRIFARVGDALTGPIIVVGKDGATVTHPEHINVRLPQGTYAITYQRAFADELRRVHD